MATRVDGCPSAGEKNHREYIYQQAEAKMELPDSEVLCSEKTVERYNSLFLFCLWASWGIFMTTVKNISGEFLLGLCDPIIECSVDCYL